MAKKPMMSDNDADDDKPPQKMTPAFGKKPMMGKGGGTLPSAGPPLNAAPKGGKMKAKNWGKRGQ